MASGTLGWCARCVAWWIRRNPMYLLSAAAMAVGARWYLVVPDAPAGEIQRILLTLGLLQAYELAVAAFLILLHRRRKSPEDLPSLLLVAALFWTGPMAATMEMTARDGKAGIGFATAACVIALGELQVIRRTIGLRLSFWGQVAAGACVLLLALAPAWLRVPYGTAGTNEVALYLCWWLLAGLALLALGGLAWHARRTDKVASAHLAPRAVHVEMAFLGLVFVATAVHLWGMNYAFFGNARAFYASPLLATLTVVLFEYITRLRVRSRALWVLCASLPAVAIGLAAVGPHDNVPVSNLPPPLRDPLLATLMISAAAWWFGYVSIGSPLLLHAGSAALAAAAFRAIEMPSRPPVGLEMLPAIVLSSRDVVMIATYALALYLLVVAWLRRSRAELVVALAAHLAACVLLVWDRTRADLLVTCLLGGWSWLAALHVMVARPRWVATVWPIAFLVLATGAFGLQAELTWYAAGHGAAMVTLLVAIGSIWPWTGYRTFGVVAGGTFLTLASGRGVTHGTHPKAALAVLSAFLLLAAGAATSWHKRSLLELAASSEPGIGSKEPRPPADA